MKRLIRNFLKTSLIFLALDPLTKGFDLLHLSSSCFIDLGCLDIMGCLVPFFAKKKNCLNICKTNNKIICI